MSKKAVVWLRDDFRIKNNSALSYATNNYDTVTVLYIYNKENFDDVREAQKWWLSKSLKKDYVFKKNVRNSNQSFNLKTISSRFYNQ